MGIKNFLGEKTKMCGMTKEKLYRDLTVFRPMIQSVKTDEMTIISFFPPDKEGYYKIMETNIDNISCFIPEKMLGKITNVSRNVLVSRYKLSEELLDEIYGVGNEQEIGFVIMSEGSIFVPTRGFMATFCNSLGAGFNKLPTGFNPYRDLFIINQLFDAKAETLKFICKHDPDCRYSIYRVFAAFSGTHTPYKTDDIISMVENILKRGYKINRYTMTHSITEIDFTDFSSAVDISGKTAYLGIRLSWSDIGDASFALQSSMIVDDSVTLTKVKCMLNHKFTSVNSETYKALVHEFFPKLIKEVSLFKLQELPEDKKLPTDKYKSILQDAGINKKAVKDDDLDISIKEFALLILTKSSKISEDIFDRTSKILQLESRVNQVIWTIAQ